MLELLEILFENHFCEKVYLNKDHNHHHHIIGVVDNIGVINIIGVVDNIG